MAPKIGETRQTELKNLERGATGNRGEHRRLHHADAFSEMQQKTLLRSPFS
jgi:hypothetical protein